MRFFVVACLLLKVAVASAACGEHSACGSCNSDPTCQWCEASLSRVSSGLNLHFSRHSAADSVKLGVAACLDASAACDKSAGVFSSLDTLPYRFSDPFSGTITTELTIERSTDCKAPVYSVMGFTPDSCQSCSDMNAHWCKLAVKQRVGGKLIGSAGICMGDQNNCKATTWSFGEELLGNMLFFTAIPPAQCPTCSQSTSCSACAKANGCQWCKLQLRTQDSTGHSVSDQNLFGYGECTASSTCGEVPPHLAGLAEGLPADPPTSVVLDTASGWCSESTSPNSWVIPSCSECVDVGDHWCNLSVATKVNGDGPFNTHGSMCIPATDTKLCDGASYQTQKSVSGAQISYQVGTSLAQSC